jgi:hypothetical protein
MVFYVYLDPEVIGVAQQQGKFAVQNLLGIIRGFVENCFLAEFENYRIQQAIGEYVKNLSDCDERKRLKTLFNTLQKRNRFIYCLIPDYTNQKSDQVILFEQASSSFIDLILLSNLNGIPVLPRGITVTDLSNYQTTNFAYNRSDLASNGKQFHGGELGEYEFLDQNYKKAFMYAKRLEICDAIFGRRFSDNFEYTAKILFKWLEIIHTKPEDFEIIFYCEKPAGNTDQYIKDRLTQYRYGRLVNTRIKIFFHSNDNDQCLPHERFLVTDQIAFLIGRGMDFIDKKTKRNRDTDINLKDPKEIENLIRHYKDYIIDEVLI